MDAVNTANTIASLLGPDSLKSKIGETLRESVQIKIGQTAAKTSADTISVRFKNITDAQSRLVQSRGAAAIEQTKYSIAQKVRGSLESILGELEEIERLNESVAAGEMTDAQANDVQIMIESRLAWINNIASETTWTSRPLLTGETIRFTTESISESGFDVSYPLVNTESLGISDLDVVALDSDTVSQLISEAITAVESHIETVEAEISVTGSSLENMISELSASFADLRGSERLNTSSGHRWLDIETLANSLRASDLSHLASSTILKLL